MHPGTITGDLGSWQERSLVRPNRNQAVDAAREPAGGVDFLRQIRPAHANLLTMKCILPLLLLAFTTPLVLAEIPDSYYPRTVFSDDFSGTEFGKRWGHYKSASVIKDGVLMGITPENSDHPAVDSVKFDPECDLEVSVKFTFVSDKAKNFNVWFDDKDYKGSHAGHICNVSVSPTTVNVGDGKTGNFRNDIYEAKKATPPTLTPEQKELLKSKNKSFPIKLTLQDWHTLLIRTKADVLEVTIDGKPVGSFQSEGVGHESKTLVSLTTVPVDVHYDDFSIKAAAKP